MTPWTTKDANRFLDGLGTPERDALPLFDGIPCPSPDPALETVRVETVAAATLDFWETLVRRAANRRAAGAVRRSSSRTLLAVAAPDGPALLAVRITRSPLWRAVLVPDGVTARRIRAGIAGGEGVGRAA